MTATATPGSERNPTGTRFMCTGDTLVVIGEAKDRFFMNADGGFLGRFRHQHFLLFLVAHFQKAALHMFSDRLVAAVSRLDITTRRPTASFAATSATPGELPALRASLLVPRDLQPGPGPRTFR